MDRRRLAKVVMLLAVTACAILFFAYALRLMSLVSTGITADREIETELRHALDDQKRLATLDPARAPAAHARFDEIATLLRRLRVLQMNREALVTQVEQLVIGAVVLLLACGAALFVFERRSREQRLVRLQAAVAALSRGEQVALNDGRRDVIGRIAAAVEQSSRMAEEDRRRLRYLEHLSAWQEAARRHAHEIRTPLTAIRMEVERLTARLEERIPGDAAEIEAARNWILREIGQLTEFTRNFTSFAAIPAPRKRPLDLHRFVEEFTSTFESAWPNLQLRVAAASGEATVSADAEMLRRVLMNLAGNSALAITGRPGTLTFSVSSNARVRSLDVSDDGPGIPAAIRARLFEPYTTSRSIGEGMGLGLAISRKILLDHGGDLDLVDSSSSGTTFRLTFPEVS